MRIVDSSGFGLEGTVQYRYHARTQTGRQAVHQDRLHTAKASIGITANAKENQNKTSDRKMKGILVGFG